jgi:SAM-dependent methyltransferase
MIDADKHDAWSAGQSYEQYMGRWSREIAVKFLAWLGAPSRAAWVDIGCGTGALTQAVLDHCSPASIVGIDPSDGFVVHARESIKDCRANFRIASAERLPLDDTAVDVATSALALNFVPDRISALQEMHRVCRPEGLISFYVWDYPGGGMGFIDAFWKAAAELDPAARELDEGTRFPFCTQSGLAKLCDDAGLAGAVIEPIEISTVFPTFEDLLQPFALGAGPAPGYYVSLDSAQQKRLQNILVRNIGEAEPVSLVARALGVKLRKS